MPSLGNTKICLDQKAGMGPENPMGLLRPDLPGYFASVKFGWQKLNVCNVGSRGGERGDKCHDESVPVPYKSRK